MNDIAIPLPWTTPPVSQNDRQHHHVKAKAVAQALTEARLAIRASAIQPIVGAGITLHYRVPDNRRRDADNLAATLKVVQDALVKEGVLPDDSWVCVPSATCRIHAPGDEPAMWVELTDVHPYGKEGDAP
jgi:Holliday junction resolvase RusA-like endonuclease